MTTTTMGWCNDDNDGEAMTTTMVLVRTMTLVVRLTATMVRRG